MMKAGSTEATVSSHLGADHARLDTAFEAASRRAGAGDFEGARAAFTGFAQGLARHIEAEEAVLFPVFDARVGMPGPTMVMRHEHRQLERLLELAAAALAASDRATFATHAAGLAAILAAHNRKEEHVLYPRTDAALDDVERAELLSRLQLG